MFLIVFGLKEFFKRSPCILSFDNLDIKEYSCGDEHIVVLLENGTVYSLGSNEYGQLGLGDKISRIDPRLIYDLRGHRITHISCGSNHTIFATDKNTLFACGNNDHDQLGVETAQQALVRPQKLTGWDSRNEIQRLYANADLSAVLTVTGDLFTFGSNEFGQLGRPTRKRADCLHPTKVSLQGPCMALGLGYRHAVAAVVQTTTNRNNSGQTILLVSWGQVNGGRLGFTKCDLAPSPQEAWTSSNWTVDRSGSVPRELNVEVNSNSVGINGTEIARQTMGPTVS
ncbi:hypothetical protein PHET_10133 [Paragonimus heterotremus]|uniref:Uncharacterized protein n=1 Tax=Paragonimus heterotremus TaxID=100268 RepID=A0A8J4SIW0_9TREM|nr:hypothetical protein PHET_10133 [Paragonimus heterotremus]